MLLGGSALISGSALLGGVEVPKEAIEQAGTVPTLWLVCNGGADCHGPTPETKNLQDGLLLHGFEIRGRVTEVAELTKILASKEYPTKEAAERAEQRILSGEGGVHGLAYKLRVAAMWVDLC